MRNVFFLKGKTRTNVECLCKCTTISGNLQDHPSTITQWRRHFPNQPPAHFLLSFQDTVHAYRMSSPTCVSHTPTSSKLLLWSDSPSKADVNLQSFHLSAVTGKRATVLHTSRIHESHASPPSDGTSIIPGSWSPFSPSVTHSKATHLPSLSQKQARRTAISWKFSSFSLMLLSLKVSPLIGYSLSWFPLLTFISFHLP